MEDTDLKWRTASYSSNGGGNCIEVADDDSRILVRDTKLHGHGPTLRFTPGAWRRLAKHIKQSLASSIESSPPDSGGLLSLAVKVRYTDLKTTLPPWPPLTAVTRRPQHLRPETTKPTGRGHTRWASLSNYS